MKKFIAIDVDGVLTNSFHGLLVKLFNERTKGNSIFIEHLYDDVRNYFKDTDVPWKEGRALVTAPGFVESFEVLPEAAMFIENLKKENIPYKFVTAPYVGAPFWMPERADWLRKHFRAQPNDIIFARDKSVVAACALVDDKITNCTEWSSENERKTAFLISRPWNETVAFPNAPFSINFPREGKQEMQYTNEKINIIRTNDFDYILEKIKSEHFNG